MLEHYRNYMIHLTTALNIGHNTGGLPSLSFPLHGMLQENLHLRHHNVKESMGKPCKQAQLNSYFALQVKWESVLVLEVAREIHISTKSHTRCTYCTEVTQRHRQNFQWGFLHTSTVNCYDIHEVLPSVITATERSQEHFIKLICVPQLNSQ